MNRSASARVIGFSICIWLASFASNGPAGAQAPPAAEDWHVTFAPYLMAASLSGDLAVHGHGAELDLSASQILDHLDLGVMSMLEARHGNWGLGVDALWVALGIAVDEPQLDVHPTLGIFTVQVLRRLASFADVMVGVRWNHASVRVDHRIRGPLELEVDQARDWVDPLVGMVLRTPWECRWHATLIADVGGFGAGSDLTWQAFPSLGFDVMEHLSVEAGWRFLATDYSTGSGRDRFAYDVVYQGPVLGTAFRF